MKGRAFQFAEKCQEWKQVVGKALRCFAVLTASLAVFQLVLHADSMVSAVHAQSAYEVDLVAGGVRRVQIAAGQSVTINSPGALGELVVADPKIADVVPLSEMSLYLLGKDIGRTTVTVYNPDNKPLGILEVEVSVDVRDLRKAIQQHLPNGNVRVGTVNGRVRLAGTVQNSQAVSVVMDLARQYAGDNIINALEVTDSQQVNLEVRFVEVNRRAGRDLGVNWGVTWGSNSGYVQGPRVFNSESNASGGVNDAALGTGAVGAALAATGAVPFATLVTTLLSNGVDIDLAIKALEEKGLARRLAEPNLTTLSGEEANFLAGGEVPFETTSDNGTNVQFKKYGVQLNFKPVVLNNGLINLKMRPEVSQPDFSIVVRGQPSFVTRSADVTVELRDGQSFAIAGLLQSINAKQVQQVPWLGQLPVVGAVFRSQGFQKEETDLVVIITPRLVRPAAPGTPLKTPLETSRNSNDPEFFLFGELEITEDEIKKFENGTYVTGPYGHEIDLITDAPNAVTK